MLKNLCINRYNSQGNKRKKNKKKIKNLFLEINNDTNNLINPIKLIPKNNTFYSKKGQETIDIRDTSPIYRRFNKFNDLYNKFNASNNKTRYKTIESFKKSNSQSKNNENIFNKKYLEISNINKDKIINLEKCLTQNEKKFKRNVSQQIIKNKKINDNLMKKVLSLKQVINDNYDELKKSKYNFYTENKKIIGNLLNEKANKMKNRTNNKKISDLKDDIKNIKNKIEQYKYQTSLYVNDYKSISDEVKNIKNQTKILPEAINNLEVENKNLIELQIIIHTNMQKIKSKLFEFEHNKKNIETNLRRANMLYE